MSAPQIKGMDQLLDRLRNAPANITSVVQAELRDGAENIAAEAKQRAPVDQGFLRQFIGTAQLDPLTFQVFSNEAYSAFVEFGTGEHVDIPPGLEEYAAQFRGGAYAEATGLSFKEAIFAWCQRHGIDQKLWYAIYVSIGIHGIEAQPFFFPAANRQTPIIIDRVEKALNKAI